MDQVSSQAESITSLQSIEMDLELLILAKQRDGMLPQSILSCWR